MKQLKQLFIHDNIHVLRGINSNSIHLIATDPPFNAKKVFNSITDNKKNKKVFDDRWRWDEVTAEWAELLSTSHRSVVELIEAAVTIEGGTVNRRTGEISTGRIKNSIAAFLCWMAPRLIEMERVLKPEGSIYIHCDNSANSYLRLLMDAIFGRERFRNAIAWCYTGPSRVTKHFPRKYDTILFYSGEGATFNKDDEALRVGYKQAVHNQGESKEGIFGKVEKNSQEKISNINKKGKLIEDYWNDIDALRFTKERTKNSFPTQKPVKLYERIITASSNPGEIVLDPFCGCSTTLVAAEKLGRQWIGIDNDDAAKDVLVEQMFKLVGPIEFRSSKTAPKRNDVKILSDKQLRILLHRKQMKCCGNKYCTSKEIRPEDLELDHILPRSRGGDDGIDNRVGLCGNCNKRKSNKSIGEFMLIEAKNHEKREKYLKEE